jgi:GT2 family glycosyltransferase
MEAMPPHRGDAVQQSPLVSVSIISHGNAEEIATLLQSLVSHEQASRLQLILTANLGDDLPDVDPSPWHSVKLLRNKQPRSFAANHNAAFPHAASSMFCLLNPDILLLEPVLERLVAHVESGHAHILSPLAVDPSGCIQDSFRPLPTPMELIRRRTLGQAKAASIGRQELIAPDWIAGFFQLMPASLFAQLGGLDEHFRMYMEDVDFCTRARLAGFSVAVDPAMRFQHGARRASRAEFRYFLWHLGSAIRFFRSPVYRQARLLKA